LIDFGHGNKIARLFSLNVTERIMRRKEKEGVVDQGNPTRDTGVIWFGLLLWWEYTGYLDNKNSS